MKNVVVTGGSGRLGPWVIKDLIAHGYDVTNVDTRQPADSVARTIVANLENLGEAYHVLLGADAVIHMAAIPVPFSNPNDVVFRNNVMSTFNLMEAAANLGIKKLYSVQVKHRMEYVMHPYSPSICRLMRITRSCLKTAMVYLKS